MDRPIAPPEVVIRYLAVVRRAFGAIEKYGFGRGSGWVMWVGHLADALHNVPGVLRRYTHDSFYTPADLDMWLGCGFVDSLRQRTAPPVIIRATEVVLRAHEDCERLGLPPGSLQLGLPSHEVLEDCFDTLDTAFIYLRMLRGGGVSAGQTGFFRELAGALAAVPGAIVNWPAFDPVAYEASARARLELVPADRRENWLSLVTRPIRRASR